MGGLIVRFNINGKFFVVNDNDATNAIKLANNILSDVLSKCKETGTVSFYPVFIMTMRLLCQNQLDLLGVDGLVALLAHSTYVGDHVENIFSGRDDADETVNAADVVQPDEPITEELRRAVPVKGEVNIQ